MREFYDDLQSGQLKPVYLFYGGEAFLIDEAVTALRRHFDPEERSFAVELLDGEDTGAAAAVAAAAEGSLFGGRRLIIVKNIGWLDEAEDKEIAPLLAYLDDPNTDNCLALTMRGNPDKRRKAFKLLQKKGRPIEAATLKDWEKEKWLEQRLRAAGLAADKKALAYICLNAANLSQLAAETEKLRLYCGGTGRVSLADAEAVVAESSLFTVFALTDAAAAKNAAAACSCYRRLLRQGEQEQKIFALIAGQFRNMLLVQDMQQNGFKPAEIAQKLSLHPFVVEKCGRFCRAFSQRQLIKALEMLLAADIAAKSGQGEMEDLLEMVILRVCAM